jgi:hypothetical protein
MYSVSAPIIDSYVSGKALLRRPLFFGDQAREIIYICANSFITIFDTELFIPKIPANLEKQFFTSFFWKKKCYQSPL